MIIYNVSDIKKVYDGNIVFASLTFNIRQGGIFCIYGRNGAGKSTLIKMLLLVEKPDSGVINFYGSLNSTGYLPQFSEHIICYSNILNEVNSFTGNITESLKILNLIGFSDKKNLPALNLSDGEKRLLFLYTNIYVNDILLLDEPFNGLDIDSKKKIKETLKMNKVNKTIIYCTNRRMDTDIADEILELKN
jgi:ABC-2 type transport system ATP-binding protein/heme exporter protein A